MAATGVSARLRACVCADWEWQMADWPEYATLIGQHGEGDGRLDDLSLAAFDRRERYHCELARELSCLDTSELGAEEAITHRLLLDQARTFVAGARFKAHLLRVSNLEGPQSDFPQVMKATPTSTREERARYISRLRAFPAQVGQIMELLRCGVNEGRVMPAVCLTDVGNQVGCVLTEEARDSVLFRPFVTGADEAEQRAALSAITTAVFPAYREFSQFMANEYLTAARQSTSCAALPDGEEMYAALLRFHTSTDLSPRQVHQAGLDEVARITAEMDAIQREVGGFEGAREAFTHHLRTDPQFFVNSAAELLELYEGRVSQVRAQLGSLFDSVPQHPLEISATPPHQATSAPAAYYFAQGPERPGLFYVNTYHLAQRPTWQVDVLTLHEAIPGHHLQAAAAAAKQREGCLPSFRANFEDRRYGTAPSRRSMNTAYLEGWALYCEGLGTELGLYQDPYSRFGRLSMDMMRACRLVVDTGLHALGWARTRAVAYMAEHCAQPLHEIEAEVTRYIAWPGQATAYKIGELEIRRLRQLVAAAAAEASADVDFALKEFHSACIDNGIVPLDVLEGEVMKQLARMRGRGV